MIWTPPMERIERLSTYEDRGYSSLCCVFTGTTNRHGYGQISDRGARWLVHRYVYTQLVGPIPAGMVIDHLCRVPACCNPAHLEVVTQAENIRRGDGPQITRERLSSVRSCVNGHDFDEANTYIKPDGNRACRRCKADRKRAARAAERAA